MTKRRLDLTEAQREQMFASWDAMIQALDGLAELGQQLIDVLGDAQAIESRAMTSDVTHAPIHQFPLRVLAHLAPPGTRRRLGAHYGTLVKRVIGHEATSADILRLLQQTKGNSPDFLSEIPWIMRVAIEADLISQRRPDLMKFQDASTQVVRMIKWMFEVAAAIDGVLEKRELRALSEYIEQLQRYTEQAGLPEPKAPEFLFIQEQISDIALRPDRGVDAVTPEPETPRVKSAARSRA